MYMERYKNSFTKYMNYSNVEINTVDFDSLMGSNVMFDNPMIKIEKSPKNKRTSYVVKISYNSVWKCNDDSLKSIGKVTDVYDISNQVSQIQNILNALEFNQDNSDSVQDDYKRYKSALLSIGHFLNEMCGVWLLYAVSKIIYSDNPNQYYILCDSWESLEHW